MTKEQTEALEKFKTFCKSYDPADSEYVLENVVWRDMALGFFLALGLSIEESYDLSGQAAYTYHFWATP